MSLSPWTLDRADSKELYALLARLDVRQRRDFLDWCCRQCPGPVRPGVIGGTDTVQEAWQDLAHAAAVFGLDLDFAARELVRRVRGK